MIIGHIKTSGASDMSSIELTNHICPLCAYEWYELTDAINYPYYCPGCGEEYDVRKIKSEDK